MHVPCDGVTVPWLKPAGQVSVRLTPVAADGPAFATVIVYVYVTPSPATTVATPSVFVTSTSALASTVFVSVAVLFPGAGSVASLLTVAEFVCEPAGVEAGTV